MTEYCTITVDEYVVEIDPRVVVGTGLQANVGIISNNLDIQGNTS